MRRAVARVGVHLAGREAFDEDVEGTLRAHGPPPDARDVGEAHARIGHGVQRHVPAVTDEHGGDALGTVVHLRRAGRVQARGVGRGEQHGRQALRVAQPVGRDAAQVGEDVLAGHETHGEGSVMSGATICPFAIVFTWLITSVPPSRDSADTGGLTARVDHSPQLESG